MIDFFGKLSTRLFTPLVIIFVFVILILITYVPSVTEDHAIDAAVASAEATVKQYKAIRGYYTTNVIKKVLAQGGEKHITNTKMTQKQFLCQPHLFMT